MNASDRELLDLAAKAISGSLLWSDDSHSWPRITFHQLDKGELWNPKIDDGDALRLGCMLGLFEYPNYGIHHCERGDFEEMRDAIVGAAAEIGKAMPRTNLTACSFSRCWT